jgi:hypothetical protein
MAGQPGHVVWHADGVKLKSAADLPARFRQRVDERHPDRLVAPPFRATAPESAA